MQIWVSVGIPFILLFAGVFVKKLATKRKLFDQRNWLMGAELTLTGLTSGLMLALESAAKLPTDEKTPVPRELVRAVIFGLIYSTIAFVVFLGIMSLHQDHEEANDPDAQRVWLVGVANIFGIAAMASFLLW